MLLHSSLSSKEQWGRLVRAFSPASHVIAIDLHGYGERAMPAMHTKFSLDDEIDLVMSTIRAQAGNTDFHLVGHSYGGAVALRLASRMPGKVRSLALYEPVAFGLLEEDDRARHEVTRLTSTMGAAIDTDRREATRLFIDYWNGEGAFARLPRALRQEFMQRIAKVPLDFQALFGDRLTLAEVARLPFPVCLMAGMRSPDSTRRIVQGLAQALPQADCHYIDAGHMAPMTHAEHINPIIASFVAAH